MRTLNICVLILTLIGSAYAGKPSQDIPITNYLTDDVLVPYYVQSDKLGAYKNGINSVVSILVANGYNGIPYGDWRLDLQASSVHTVAITFSAANAVQPGDPGYITPANPQWWGTQNNAVRTETKCTLISTRHSILSLATRHSGASTVGGLV